jgi:hypothetical protein
MSTKHYNPTSFNDNSTALGRLKAAIPKHAFEAAEIKGKVKRKKGKK